MSQTQEGLLPLNSLQPAGLVQELKAEAQRREYRTPRLSGRRCSRGLSRRAKAGGGHDCVLCAAPATQTPLPRLFGGNEGSES